MSDSTQTPATAADTKPATPDTAPATPASITLSESAAGKIRELLAELGDETKLLRLFIEPGGCSGFEYGMGFDDPRDDDHSVESHGVRLIVDPASMEYLQGAQVDFDDGLGGKGFEIHNPNAQSSCGCGKSFS